MERRGGKAQSNLISGRTKSALHSGRPMQICLQEVLQGGGTWEEAI